VSGVMIGWVADAIVAFALTIFGGMAGIVHWLARPHVLSIALMVVWYGVVEDFRRNRSKRIFFLPLLIALWANLHGAFVATFPMLAIYAAGEWVEFAARGDWTTSRNA